MKFPYHKTSACIFDLDGTLLDSMGLWQDIDKEYLARFNIPFDDQISEDIKSMTFNESADYFLERFELPKTKEEIMDDWNEMAEEAYRDTIPTKPGVHAFLADLEAHNIKMCIATSCTKEHALLALDRLGILKYFDFLLTCKDVGKNKEFPDVFLACAKKLDVPIKKTMVFEDLLVALQVAKKEGFQTCAVEDILTVHQNKEVKAVADIFIRDFTEFER
ncbi:MULTISPECIES: HAD family phosphatase [unclassified Breznakia]|uniref:HAD family hydrolase n=1 Tax=unclassified Breznakia TaxID=2623764 RepID=UPI002475EDF2|nr:MULTISPECIES: HAD family phosphatase [unclassified Breznakia]MDH6367705.1 HAD superfamily hydrolase (TIGR01509 family) [Breznakia sp. PH1-1]MDH6404793.1 HAD superfamily hydrolase (TIGR01509 family) [Breznakia sp. PF1-11]MDH6412500.1 HAD superfamily hydrolase (TIGR01509 family) [Breznakia sp. PFB1-11]MDH6414860.1 HAD superfamily hydrolase (TIGR01509 family) [Breznakia sp. PFB1-14]MDH6417171.1 HAD superfamily hydrolase (TIGR01509 family) [Breznakia sp. PFB1-4]